GVSGSDHPDRRGSPSSRRKRIHRSLPRRAKSPGNRESAGSPGARLASSHWSDRVPQATWWAFALLPSSGVGIGGVLAHYALGLNKSIWWLDFVISGEHYTSSVGLDQILTQCGTV